MGMKARLVLLLLAVLLAGCAANGYNLKPGISDVAAVRADMGAPAETVPLPDGGQAWFYPRGTRTTYRVEIGPDGKVRSVEQVMDENVFDRIVKGKTTADELRAMLGSPFYIWRVRTGETLWEYRYNWGMDDPWKLYVGIGPDGIVTGQARYHERDAPQASM